MTIIAFKNGIMASDSAVFNGDTMVGSMNKIVRGIDGTIGGACGRSGICSDFLEWVRKGRQGEFHNRDKSEEFLGLIFCTDEVLRRLDHAGSTYELYGKYFAIGAGQDLAIGAMAAGASAIEAVQIAIDHSTHCGGAVTALAFGEVAV